MVTSGKFPSNGDCVVGEGGIKSQGRNLGRGAEDFMGVLTAHRHEDGCEYCSVSA